MNPGLHVYHDTACLVTGKEWVIGFKQGLLRSKVIVLMVSAAALERLRRAHLYPDNMLLEWEHALELHALNHAIVVPVLLPDPTSGARFTEFSTDIYPNFLHQHDLSPAKCTIRDTMKKVLALQGEHFDSVDSVALKLMTLYKNPGAAQAKATGKSFSTNSLATPLIIDTLLDLLVERMSDEAVRENLGIEGRARLRNRLLEVVNDVNKFDAPTKTDSVTEETMERDGIEKTALDIDDEEAQVPRCIVT
ncbi:hypothetical protein HDV00_008063 [Rhizophlyctis rosea]|nr:hypothetical protein HDV00_008063 [Rhizophlyctis rosea]